MEIIVKLNQEDKTTIARAVADTIIDENMINEFAEVERYSYLKNILAYNMLEDDKYHMLRLEMVSKTDYQEIDTLTKQYLLDYAKEQIAQLQKNFEL